MSCLQERGIHKSVQVVVLTDLRPESALTGSTDLEALVRLGNNLPKFDLTHLPSLHAKVYVADRSMAVITSGNLTDSGINRNIEYGVVSTDTNLVAAVRRDFESYALLGAKISSEEIAALLDEIKELKDLFQKAEHTIRAKARRAFKEKLEATHVRILRHRAKSKTTHAIFSETILFLLAKGPLRTIELHPLIQGLHPDVCDDGVPSLVEN
jgi:phosphatidylserine/phosphatidylglycerophosphate/cardiolipin synthase-like enzyme